MTFFTGDLHLGHSSIISSCHRPFGSVQEMDKALIDNWNSRVTDRDQVYILGDLAYKSSENVETYLKKLKGIKHLIIGNHDNYLCDGFDVSKYFASVQQTAFIGLDGKRIFMCHYPMMEWNDSFHGSYLVYGHIHNNFGQEYWNLIQNNNRMLNAGVDVNNYYPVTFDELVQNNKNFKEEAAIMLQFDYNKSL